MVQLPSKANRILASTNPADAQGRPDVGSVLIPNDENLDIE
jgi:hypothetical protein